MMSSGILLLLLLFLKSDHSDVRPVATATEVKVPVFKYLALLVHGGLEIKLWVIGGC
jgi:hypothetical protein